MYDFVKLHRTLLLLAFIGASFYLSFGYDLVRSDFIKLSLLYAALFFITYKIIQISKGSFWLLVGFGILFRLIFIVSTPNLSQDFYRFLWDGRLLLQGINPYLFTPDFLIQSSIQIVPQTETLVNGMGALNASHYSNYPPINQLFFAIAAVFAGKSILGSVVVLRLILILADLGVLYFGRKIMRQIGINPHQIFWYFLNPFIIIELIGNLHFEGLMLFFLMASLYLLYQKKWFYSALLLAVSISIKLIPLLFLPLYYRYFVTEGLFSKGFWKLKKFVWVVMGAVLLTFAPFLSSDFISNFSTTIGLWFHEFEFNASIHYIVRWISFKTIGWNLIEITGIIFSVLVLLFVLFVALFRKNNSLERLITVMLFSSSFYLMMATTVHPWYLATPLLLSLFTRYKYMLVWSLVVVLSYSAYRGAGFEENLWLVGTEYLLVFAVAIWELFLKKDSNRLEIKMPSKP